MLRMGLECRRCKCADHRVLEFNHPGGVGAVNYAPDVDGACGRNIRVQDNQIKDVALGRSSCVLELLCSNCNGIHEYERGNRAEVSGYVWDVLDEHSKQIEINRILNSLRSSGVL